MQYDRMIKITTGTSRKATIWNGQEMYWSDFLQKLCRPVRTQESFCDYKSLPKPEQDKLKDIVLSCKLDAPAPCRLDAPDFDVARWGTADCLHQHQQVI